MATDLKTIFVTNFPYETSEQQLRDVFSCVGDIVEVFIPTDRETGKKKGYAFIEYGTKELADSAMQLCNGQEFYGRNLKVNMAQKNVTANRPQKRPRPQDTGSDPRMGLDSVKKVRTLAPHSGGSIHSVSDSSVRTGIHVAPNVMQRGVAIGSRKMNAGADQTTPFVTIKLVRALTRQQIVECLLAMQQMYARAPQQATQFLLRNPQLAVAMEQMVQFLAKSTARSPAERKDEKVEALLSEIPANLRKGFRALLRMSEQELRQVCDASQLAQINGLKARLRD